MKKKIIPIILVLLIIASNFAFATVLPNENQFETFKIEELENHKDVIEYFSENGYGNLLDKLAAKASYSNSSLLLDKQIKEEIAMKYGLTVPDTQYDDSIIDIYVLVEKTGQVSISNAWVLQYIRNNDGFTVNALNVGLDGLDKISGDLELQKLNRETWSVADRDDFEKFNVRSGTVYTWSKPKTSSSAVAENFGYEIRVTEDGFTYTYSNEDNIDQFRYNFEVGAFSSIAPNGGERHHFVSSDSLGKAGGFSTNAAPCIRMIYRDHTMTPNYGNWTSSKLFRAEELRLLNLGQYEELLQMEVDAFEATPDPGGAYNTLADKYFNEVIEILHLYEQYFGI